MQWNLLMALSLLMFCSTNVQAQEVIDFQLWDGENTKGRLSFPSDMKEVPYLVVYIHGTGPGTYLDKRNMGGKEFNYYDVFADKFGQQGVGFLSYNRRGVTISDEPPMYNAVDSVKFKKYLPMNEAKDVESIIAQVKQRKGFKNTKIILLGWSEGTIIATLIAERKKVNISALLLCGYANESMYDIIAWQYSGKSSMLTVCKCFDLNDDGVISREEYESMEKMAQHCRTTIFGNTDFGVLDQTKDSIIDHRDFKVLVEASFKTILEMAKKGNNAWIWKNYFQITSEWMKAHFQLEANKTRMLRLDLPVYIFQGMEDASTPVEGAMDIKERFEYMGKNNLSVQTFDGHDHDLNYTHWLKTGELSKGMKAIFDATKEIVVSGN